MQKRSLQILLAVALAAAWSPWGEAREVRTRDTLHTLDFSAEEEVQIPIELVGHGAVALQFEIEYDQDLLELRGGETTYAAERHGKKMTVRHLTGGRARVVVFGYNLEPLPEGVLGTVRFKTRDWSAGTALRAKGCEAVDAGGRDLSAAVRNGRILVRALVGSPVGKEKGGVQ